MRVSAAISGLVALAVQGCASQRYVHWEDDWDSAVSRAEASSRERTAKIAPFIGDTIEAADLALTRDSLTWGPRSTRFVTGLPLGEIESISIVQRQGTRPGALIGALAGLVAIGVSYSDCFGYACELTDAELATIFAGATLLGAGFGALVGMGVVEWVHFVP